MTDIRFGPSLKRRTRVGPAEIAAVVRGPEAAPPVLFLHGFPTHGWLWRKVLVELGDDVRALVPDLPGMKEAGLHEYNLEFWYGLFVPAGTPAPIVKKLHDAAVSAMQQPSVKAALARDGTEVSLSGSPEAFEKFLVEDGKFWVNLAKSANLKVD